MPGGRDTTKRLPGTPLIAGGTDVPNNCPVQIVSTGGALAVRPVANNSEPIDGISRASAINGQGVDVLNIPGEVQVAVAAASIAQGAFIGVASANPVAGASGNIQVPQIATVAKASASNRFTLGKALEGAAPGNTFRYYFKPEQLSGLT